MRTPACLFICVHYHGMKETREFLGSLDALKGNGYHCIVVDNSDDFEPCPGVAEAVREGLVTTAKPHENLGYFNGAQFGLDQFEGALPDWVVVCNADVTPRYDFLERLASATVDDRSGVLAPRIVSMPDGEELNPHLVRRPTAVAMHVRKLFLCSRLLRPLYFACNRFKRFVFHALRRPTTPRRPAPGRAVIYAAHGSCLVFHRRYFEAGGTLRHSTFLFGEEITVAETVRKLGLRILFEPSLQVQHRQHSSTGKDPGTAAYQAESLRTIVGMFFPLFSQRHK